MHELFIEQIMITLYGQTFSVSKMYDIFILAMHQWLRMLHLFSVTGSVELEINPFPPIFVMTNKPILDHNAGRTENNLFDTCIFESPNFLFSFILERSISCNVWVLTPQLRRWVNLKDNCSCWLGLAIDRTMCI